MIINGQEIRKAERECFIDGRQWYWGRDGRSIVNSVSQVVLSLTAEQAAEVLREEETIKTARSAAKRTPPSRSSRLCKEREFDRGYNEGGEGYNPYRYGAAKTYRR